MQITNQQEQKQLEALRTAIGNITITKLNIVTDNTVISNLAI